MIPKLLPEQARTATATLLPLAVASGAALGIFLIKGSVPIWDDGAEVIAERYPLTIERLLTPYHNQLHVIPLLLWSWLPGPEPKLALLLVFHVTLVGVAAAILADRVGSAVGVALTLPLAVFGAAAYDLIVPWQIVFVLPVLGVMVATWASVNLDRSPARVAIVVISTIASVLSSNVGMVGLAGLGLWFALERRWRQVLELTPAGLIAGMWLISWGLGANASPISHPQEITSASPPAVLAYIGSGLAAGIGGWFGVDGVAATSLGIVVVVVAVFGMATHRWRMPPATFAFVAAVVAMFAALSLIRSNADPHQAVAGRYAYLVAFLIAGGIAASGVHTAGRRWLLWLSVPAALLNLRLLSIAMQIAP